MQYIAGEDPVTVFANKAACEILGYDDLPDLLRRRGARAFSHIPDPDRRAVEAHMETLLQGDATSYDFHHRVIRGDGATGWIRGTATLVGDAGSRLVQAAFNDTTAYHAHQYERDRERYAAVLCSAFDEVFEVDVENGFSRLLSSKLRPDIAGTCLPLEQALDIWERRVIGEHGEDGAVATVRGFASDDAPSEAVAYRMRLGGRTVWIETILMRMGREGFLCCNQDVTERMRHEDERISQSIGHIVTRLPVGIGVFAIRDRQAIPLYVSDPVCEMLGYTREEYDRRIASKEPLFNAALLSGSQLNHSSTFEAQQAVGAEVELARRDGSPLTVRIRGSLTHARSGGFTLFAAIADVTEEVRLQNAQAWQSERYRLLSELTGSISFDYNSRTDTALLYIDRGNGIEAQTIPDYLKNIRARAGVVHHDDISTVHDPLSYFGETESVVFEYRADYRGDGFRWYRANLFKVDDFDGVWHLIGIMEDVQEERDLIRKAESDLLTGVANHATTKDLFAKTLNDPALKGKCVCALIDVDDFKNVNDSFGHVKGDELLEAVGSLARGACRSSDIVGRVGGDEFAVLFKGASLDAALSRLDDIRNKAIDLGEQDPCAVSTSLSIGVYDVEPHVSTYEEAIARADEALYASKRKGKNRVSVYGTGK